MESAWILLTVIFAVLISILIYEKRKRTNHQSQLNISEKFIINENKAGTNKVITMRLSLEGETITLVDAVKLFQPKSIRLNSKGIFEKRITDSFSYFIANLKEPGYFKDDQSIAGFTFFFVSSYEIDDKRYYKDMKKDVNEINSIINGKVIDDSNFMNELTNEEFV
tara:strand:- start:5523 stop:6020 length:498 start_codon:yes stop_codon:yes gene_type:complete